MTALNVSVFLHILAATAWIGSMIFFAAVVVPVVRRAETRAQASALIRVLGARYRVLGWVSLSTLLITGVTNLSFRGMGWSTLTRRDFWSTGYGHVLGAKLFVIALVVIATFTHELIATRRQLDSIENDPVASERFRRRASVLGRVTMLLSLTIVFLAVLLVRGPFF